jgi:hypothetical protein
LKNRLTAGASPSLRAGKNYRPFIGGAILILLFAALFLVSGFLQKTKDKKNKNKFLTQDELFDVTKIRDLHLTFKDSAWHKMKPYGGTFETGGFGQGWVDFSLFLSSPFLDRGDLNYDNNLTHDEFITLAETWFKEWNTKGDSALDFDMLGNGMDSEGWDLRAEEGERNGVVGAFGGKIPISHADLKFEGRNFPSAQIRYKGNGTLYEAKGLKRSFKIDLDAGFPSRDLADVSKLTLHNLVTDGSYMNDVLVYRLFRDAKVPASRTSYVRIYATVPDSLDNQYLGLYLLVETVDNNFAKYWYGTKKGALFKPVTPHLFKYRGDDWKLYNQSYDPKTTLSPEAKNRIIETCKFVTNASDEEFALRLSEYFDLDNLARYLAINVWVCDIDGIFGPGQNFYIYLHPKTMQISFIPWDHDHSFGQMARGSQELRENLSIEKPWMWPSRFLERVYADEQFKKLYYQYLKEFNETILKPERLMAQMKEIIPTIRPSIQEESAAQLRRFDIVAGITPDLKDTTKVFEGLPPKFPREFIPARHKGVANQLNGKSKGERFESGLFPGWYGSVLLAKMDVNKDSLVNHKEFIQTFEKWYNDYSKSDSSMLTYEELRNALNIEMGLGPDPKKIAAAKADSIKQKNN